MLTNFDTMIALCSGELLLILYTSSVLVIILCTVWGGEPDLTHCTFWHQSTGQCSEQYQASDQRCAPKRGKCYLDCISKKQCCSQCLCKVASQRNSVAHPQLFACVNADRCFRHFVPVLEPFISLKPKEA